MQLIKNKKKLKKIKISLYILLFIIAIILLFLPKDFFDSGQSICLSVLFLDTECFGCGMTRAIQHLIHLDFDEALYYNKLSFIVLPLLVVQVISGFIKLIKSDKGDEK